jgi:hypothetical protein
MTVAFHLSDPLFRLMIFNLVASSLILPHQAVGHVAEDESDQNAVTHARPESSINTHEGHFDLLAEIFQTLFLVYCNVVEAS